MPIAVTYPGVYIEELDSGPTAIAPVATNICAFVGRALFGPTDKVMTCFNYGDFQRNYGGLQFDYPMSYAVQDFFNNGGSQAVIARLFEPTVGSGVAQLKFPPAPPLLPDEWVLDTNATAGTSTLPVAMSGGAEGEPVSGMTLTFAGDRTQYLVTNYVEGDPSKKTANTITIIPPLQQGFQKCTALTFAYGASATGWTVVAQSQGKLTLTGGSGLPELGQLFQFGTNPAVYTAISQPVVTGNSLSALTVVLTITPTPAAGAVGFGATATISDPAPLPMPTGWEIDNFATPSKPSPSGSMTLINGSGAPLVGDWFTIGNAPDVYVVTGFAAATAKAEATLSFTAMSQQNLDPTVFCHCCPPIFSRQPPSGMSIKAGPKVGDTKFTYARGAAASGVVDIGDTFTVSGDSNEYSVRYVDQSGNIYFLPEAATAFSGTSQLTFAPPLTLAAMDPGQWGNFLTASADTNGITKSTAAQFQTQYGLEQDDLFNLTLTLTNTQGKTVAKETYLNVSIRTDGNAGLYPNRLDRVLNAQSDLAVVAQMPGTPPFNATAKGTGGNDGTYLTPATYLGNQSQKTGIYLLEKTLLFNLLCIPPDQRFLPGQPQVDLDSSVRGTAAEYATDRRAFYIVDPLAQWTNDANNGDTSDIHPDDLNITGMNSAGIEVARNAAVYFPRLIKEDILMKSQPAVFAPCGAVAGIMAATDVARGVWKAPAGTAAGVAGILDFDAHLTDNDSGQLNPLGINCLRNLPTIGPVVWGARTLRGADAFEDAYKYVPVRRLTLFIEDSLYQGTQWAVFEPNDEALWSALRLQVGSFLADLARQGAFYNYAVTCDATTTTPDDIANGVVNILVQIAPVKPAEFVVLQIQQIAGSTPA
jgi:phage tail sheath protein FI